MAKLQIKCKRCGDIFEVFTRCHKTSRQIFCDYCKLKEARKYNKKYQRELDQ